MSDEIYVTIFTPSYNRANTLQRVYSSLVNQTYKNFEWLIVDDGSIDNTKEVIESFKEKNEICIRYYYQENAGKHTAINMGVNMAQGDMFVIADSDDSFLPDSLEYLLYYWVQVKDKSEIKGITCRCINEKAEFVGNKPIPEPFMDISELDIRFKMKYNYEMWGMIRTEVMREFPFPETKGLRFYPECIIWNRMARKYKTRYINKGLRIYFQDQENATMNKGSSTRANENFYMWIHYINEVFDYFKYDPIFFIKAAIAVFRDGLLTKRRPREIYSAINGFWKRIFIGLLSPIGFLLFIKTIR